MNTKLAVKFPRCYSVRSNDVFENSKLRRNNKTKKNSAAFMNEVELLTYWFLLIK